MVPTDCWGDGTPARRGSPRAPWRRRRRRRRGVDDDPVGGDGGAVVVQSSTRTLVPLRTSPAGPSTVLVEEVSLTVNLDAGGRGHREARREGGVDDAVERRRPVR